MRPAAALDSQTEVSDEHANKQISIGVASDSDRTGKRRRKVKMMKDASDHLGVGGERFLHGIRTCTGKALAMPFPPIETGLRLKLY